VKLPEYEMSMVSNCIDRTGSIDLKLNAELSLTNLNDFDNLERIVAESTHKIFNLFFEFQNSTLNQSIEEMVQLQADRLQTIMYESNILCQGSEELLKKFNSRERVLHEVLSINHENFIDLVSVRNLLK
jgi:hypothetical protein